MRRVLFRPRAREDLLEIWEFIARDSVSVADRVAAEIEAEIRRRNFKRLFRKET